MKIQVNYQEKVSNNGTFVVSATVKSDATLTNKKKDISFSIDNKEIKISKIEEKGNSLVYYFEKEDPLLSILKFDMKKFVNNINLPQILLTVKGERPNIEVEFIPDPFIKDFQEKILQTNKIQLSYSIYASGSDHQKRPLVLFLHGSGERGFNNGMPLLGNDVPKTIYEYARDKEDAVVLIPQATWAPTLNGWFRKDFREALFLLLKQVEQNYNIDSKRIYLTGLSNGASTTWYMGANHANTFAALVPCSGYIYEDGKKGYGNQGEGRYMLATPEEGKVLATLPIWAFHAEDDPTVGVLGTKKAAAAIKAAGGQKLKTTIYPKGTVKPNPHASWSLAYDNPELLPWLFKQHK